MQSAELLDRDATCRFFGGTRPINPATLYPRAASAMQRASVCACNVCPSVDTLAYPIVVISLPRCVHDI